MATLVAWLSLDVRSGGLVFVSGGLGAGILVLLGVVLVFGRAGGIGIVLVLLGLLYLGHLAVAGESDLEATGLVAVALLLVGELSQWSIDARFGGRYETGVHVARATGIAWLGLLALAVVIVSRIAAALPAGGGIGLAAIAMAATVALLGLIALVARRRLGGLAHRDAPGANTIGR